MTKFLLKPFLNSTEYALKLEEFEPKGGYEPFLKDVCPFLGATFLDWYQGIESGIGKIIYKGYKMTVFWTDFPQSLSFDCEDQAMAQQLQKELEDYFHLHEERWASAWKQY
jgi:hypothetical protein